MSTSNDSSDETFEVTRFTLHRDTGESISVELEYPPLRASVSPETGQVRVFRPHVANQKKPLSIPMQSIEGYVIHESGPDRRPKYFVGQSLVVDQDCPNVIVENLGIDFDDEFMLTALGGGRYTSCVLMCLSNGRSLTTIPVEVVDPDNITDDEFHCIANGNPNAFIGDAVERLV